MTKAQTDKFPSNLEVISLDKLQYFKKGNKTSTHRTSEGKDSLQSRNQLVWILLAANEWYMGLSGLNEIGRRQCLRPYLSLLLYCLCLFLPHILALQQIYIFSNVGVYSQLYGILTPNTILWTWNDIRIFCIFCILQARHYQNALRIQNIRIFCILQARHFDNAQNVIYFFFFPAMRF